MVPSFPQDKRLLSKILCSSRLKLCFKAVATVILALSCTDRERTNPLDPLNPDTLGRPTGFRAFSIDDTVHLSWDVIDLRDLRGFQIYRKMAAETEFTPLWLTPPTSSTFTDSNISFNTEYVYFMTAVVEDFESPPSDTLSVVPGPTLNWVASNRNQRLLKLTHDLQHAILTINGFLPIFDIEANPRTGDVWVIERFLDLGGNAIRITANGEILRPFVAFTEPIEAALDYRSSSLWVADLKAGTIVKLDSNAAQVFSSAEFPKPASVSIDQRDGSCWVAGRRRNQIGKISADGSRLDISPVPLNSAKLVAVNSEDGSVWVSDSTRVLRISEEGQLDLVLSVGFSSASRIAVNDLTGDVWIIDLGPSTVSKFSANGQRVFEVGGFAAPADLVVSLFDNSCLVADTENNRLVRLTEDGIVSRIVDEIGLPDAVEIQNESSAGMEN